MKRNHIFFSLILMIGLGSCAPPVVFTEPQPDVLQESETFDPTYQGHYFCTGDSSVVRISPTTIWKERQIKLNTTLDDIENTDGVYLDGDLLYIEETDTPVHIEFLDDGRVGAEFTISDTLFEIGHRQVLKLYRGHQIMSSKISNRNWAVQILSKDEVGNLSLYNTKLPEDLQSLEEITPVEDISSEEVQRYRLSPNIAEFRKLLESKLIFEACDYFERIDESI
ncbi:MAG: hypothetical protein AAFP77_07555 [Bacteroidota bacterium]